MKVLIADDEAMARVMLKNILEKRGYVVVTASDGDEAYKLLQRDDAPNLAIVDWMMPGMTGIELCRKLRQTENAKFVYVIMLSSRGETCDLVAGMEAGADDYISKPFNIDELHVRLRAGLRIVRMHEQLRAQANSQDELTGVFNRGSIAGILRRELSHASRDSKPLSVILASIDNFDGVNHMQGRVLADPVLRQVPMLLSAVLRPYDALGRHGEQEFLVVLPGCTIESAHEVAERVRSALANNPIQTSAGPVVISVNLGIAGATEHTVEPEELIFEADQALQLAKQNAGDCSPGTTAASKYLVKRELSLL